ncbi:type II toxin-antitoxin system RelE/ParE family toxin [Pseudomonas akapageensis]|uniref:type II toxin-antitoxin system RelE/ParE family toxin n=1 Tax=Pseudomonas akapageensis TaxID=2609961 RepID=UPI00140C7741|nr:type II toxin-antitoxin system RelE/ParE family toxin [Pseudomonas akapageensis]
MGKYRISQDARADIIDILQYSQAQFGHEARRRYQGPILAALNDIASEPDRIGSSPRDEIAPGLRSLHLFHCRSRSSVDKVQRPRHIVFYRLCDGDVIEVVRLLHDAMEVRLHLPVE